MNEKIKLFGYAVQQIQNFNLLILMQIENAVIKVKIKKKRQNQINIFLKFYSEYGIIKKIKRQFINLTP